MSDTYPYQARRRTAAFSGGSIIGVLGGLIGLGGAEFRLPLLIGVFRFVALGMVHVFPANLALLHAAREALDNAGGFLRRHLAVSHIHHC
jgi:hypothetical protein